jgi:quercetin dioxygenase-like cupin family protein
VVLAGGVGLPCTASLMDKPFTVQRSGSEPSTKSSPEWFTGLVRVDPMLREIAPSRMSGGLVSCEPEARTVWHTHPLGQILIVMAGAGRVQQ